MSQRMSAMFAKAAEEKRTALIPYIMAGDPVLQDTVKLMHRLVAHGADMIEVGFPFSDPMADGPIIQDAARRALAAGANLRNSLQHCAAFRREDDTTPLILMGYANPIMQYGYTDFIHDCEVSGIDGLIIVDLPLEEEHELGNHLRNSPVSIIRLIAPTTPDERIAQAAEHAKGCLYLVAIKGITGSQEADIQALNQRVKEVRHIAHQPIITGFGIKEAKHVTALRDVADGVVIGSALIDTLHATAQHGGNALESAAAFIDNVHAATQRRHSWLGKMSKLFG